MVCGTVVNGEENGEERRLRLFEKSVITDIFYALQDHRPPSRSNNIVAERIMQLARRDAW